MMTIVQCEYCGNSSLPFGNVSVDLTMHKSEIVCKHCNNISKEIQNMMFCTTECLLHYMRDVLDGKRPFAWKEPPWINQPVIEKKKKYER